MDSQPELREDIREFLTSRRAKVTPQQVGLPAGRNRRVPGLRRTELATLAGVSVEYYAKLERGNLAGVSDEVLEALSRALELDEAERAHLHDLANSSSARPKTRQRIPPQPVRPSIQAVLNAITEAPAVVNNDRGDLIATNLLGRALFSEMFVEPTSEPVNHSRFLFLDPRAVTFYRDWSRVADQSVASLRTVAGRDPCDRSLSDLVGELSTRSEEFRTRWAAHNVRQHFTGTKLVKHPVVGAVDLTFDAFSISADDGLTLVVYTARAHSTHEDALSLLSSWVTTKQLEDSEPPPSSHRH